MFRRHHKHRLSSPLKFRRLAVEPLESRAMLAANLEVTGALLVYGNDRPIAAPVLGEATHVRVEWRSTDLTANQTYRVRVAIDNVPLDSPQILGVAGTNVAQSQVVGGWIATAGQHNVQVTMDSDGAVAETSEADNARSFSFTAASPTSLPAKLRWPMGGQQTRDWSITSYADVDPRTGTYKDFQGGPFTYDGHLAADAMLTNFSRMDSGVPVFAAAAGVVTEVADGYLDDRGPTSGRACVLPSPQVCANRILIDHGQNWFTEYVHLEQGSITVRPGDSVTAGQLLGLTGGSGTFNEGAHLHFALWHGPDRVETFISPTDYWLDPPAYEGSLPPRVVDSGITNLFDPAADFAERPSSLNIFPTSHTGKIVFWTNLSHLLAGDTFAVRWFRPNGDLDYSFGDTVSLPRIHFTYPWEDTSDWLHNPGQWLVTLDINGTEAARATFQISSQQTVPELRVTQGGKQIVDERLTPIDFGSLSTGAAPPQKSFVLTNHGSAPLTIDNLETPPGFSVVGAVPASVAAGKTATLTLQLDTTRAGHKFGQVRFHTNDADESRFNFYIVGDVTGTDPAGAPRIVLTNTALGVSLGDAAKVLDSAAMVTDSDSANFNGGHLIAEFAGGEAPHDQLAIQNQGAAANQISLASDKIRFGGIEIGSFRGGSGGMPLDISLNSSATPIAAQALLRAITFVNSPAVPVTVPRFVRFTLIDDAQHTSNQPVKMIVVAGAAPNQLPSISAPADVATSQNTATPPLTFAIGDTETPAGSLTMTAASSNTQLVPVQNVVFAGSDNYRTVRITPAQNQSGESIITLAVTDANGATATSSFRVTVRSHPWQNPANPFDVNADTFVVAQDAIIIINALNSGGSRPLPPPSQPITDNFLDADGDDNLAPLDALLVINRVNQGAGGEGELAAVGSDKLENDIQAIRPATAARNESATNLHSLAWFVVTSEERNNWPTPEKPRADSARFDAALGKWLDDFRVADRGSEFRA